MKKLMTTAHEIKRAAAVKWDCAEKEIVFGICLHMAHKGEEIKKEISNMDEAKRVANLIETLIAEKEAGMTFSSEKQKKYYTDLKTELFRHISEELGDEDTDRDMISFWLNIGHENEANDDNLTDADIKNYIETGFETVSTAINYMKNNC